MTPRPLHVAMASPEVSPFAKTGGLGEVLGSLPTALERLGVRVSLVMPAYRSVLRGGFPLEDTGIRFTAPVSGRKEVASLLKTMTGTSIPVYLIRADRYFDRDHLYGAGDRDYPDNAERFVFFSRAVLEVMKLDPPAILHCHDWEPALAVAFLKAQPEAYPALSSLKAVFTVHNLGYQGIFGQPDWHLLSLDSRFFTLRYLEFYGNINFLKGGLVFADAITTVSPTYAEEVKTSEQGFGLDGVLRERARCLTGILNGVDYDVWNPDTDRFIARNYNRNNLSGKIACKSDLQRSLGLHQDAAIPVIGMVSRLALQKGFDLLEGAFDDLMSRGIQFVLLGTGEGRYERFFGGRAARHGGRVGARFAYDEALAHKVVAGADILLMPSRYEPSGLTQIRALRYGTIPVVRATGGLRDTVDAVDTKTGQGTGFLFGPYTSQALLEAVDRAMALFRRREAWTIAMRNAMAADFSWNRSAQAYLDLYLKVLGD